MVLPVFRPLQCLLLVNSLISSFVLLSNQIAQAVPTELYPVPSNICEFSSFYRVRTPDGLPLKGHIYRSDRTISIPNGTIIIEQGVHLRWGPNIFALSLYINAAQDHFSLARDSNPENSLVKLSFGSHFRGKMQVKTLEKGAYLNIWKDASVVGTVVDGTEVTILGTDTEAPRIGEAFRLYIVTPSGIEGYVEREYLVCPL